MSTSVGAVNQSALSVSIACFALIADIAIPVRRASLLPPPSSAKSSRPSVGRGGGTPRRPDSTLLVAVQPSTVGLVSGRVAVQSITTQPLCVEAGAVDSADETRRRRGPLTAYAAPLPKLKRPTRAPSPVRQRNHPLNRRTATTSENPQNACHRAPRLHFVVSPDADERRPSARRSRTSIRTRAWAIRR